MTTQAVASMTEFQHSGLLDLLEQATHEFLLSNDPRQGLQALALVHADEVKGLDAEADAYWSTLAEYLGSGGAERLQSDVSDRDKFKEALLRLYESLIRESEECEQTERALES